MFSALRCIRLQSKNLRGSQCSTCVLRLPSIGQVPDLRGVKSWDLPLGDPHQPVSSAMETGIDGVWWDRPEFMSDLGTSKWQWQWACHCSDCKALFRKEKGADIPSPVDFESKTWRDWIEWRFEKMGKFIADCRAPKFPPYHLFEYSPATLARLLKNCGLRIVEQRSSLIVPELLEL